MGRTIVTQAPVGKECHGTMFIPDTEETNWLYWKVDQARIHTKLAIAWDEQITKVKKSSV